MCWNSASKRDGFVYKRRKLQENSLALLSEENTLGSRKGSAGNHSCVSSEDSPLKVLQGDDLERAPVTSSVGCSRDLLDKRNLSVRGQDHLNKLVTIPSPQIESVPNSRSDDIQPITKYGMPTKPYVSNLSKSAALEHCSSVNDQCSSSKSNMESSSSFVKIEVHDAGECSSSNVVIAEKLGEYMSTRELCITVLRGHGLLGGTWSNACVPMEILCDNDSNLSLTCKKCGRLDNPQNLLICDLCEEAYHLPCCHPRVKKLPIDEWYCQPCLRKKPDPLIGTTGGLSEHGKLMTCGDLDPISFMLKDNQPYISGVRIGKDFQADVPEWSSPIFVDHNYFGELSEVDPAEFANLNGGDSNMPSKPSSIGNWIQCRQVINSYGTDKGVICGKWRRAPIFAVQTDNWDCSCSVLWDPIHADCAVSQELETDEVLKHLEYIKKLRPRLANRFQKAGQT